MEEHHVDPEPRDFAGFDDGDPFGLPKTLLQYSAPVLASSVDREAIFPDVIAQQTAVLSDTPVVTTTDKVLNSILPPREFTAYDGEHYIQVVSPEQTTREALHELSELVDFKMHDSKARHSGLCPVRRAIFSMLFDELIRQVTIDNAERGLLLLRVRDEIRMSIDAHKCLVESSSGYCNKNLHDASRGKPEMMEQIRLLNEQREALSREKKRLEAKYVALVRATEEQQLSDNKRYAEEKNFLESIKQRLLSHLDFEKHQQELERRALRQE